MSYGVPYSEDDESEDDPCGDVSHQRTLGDTHAEFRTRLEELIVHHAPRHREFGYPLIKVFFQKGYLRALYRMTGGNATKAGRIAKQGRRKMDRHNKRFGISLAEFRTPPLAEEAYAGQAEHAAFQAELEECIFGHFLQDLSLSYRSASQNFEYAYMRAVLRSTRGNICAATRIAERGRREMYRSIEQYGIDLAEIRVLTRSGEEETA